MSYIREIEPQAAEEELRNIYERLMGVRQGRLPTIFKVMSLHPRALLGVEGVNQAVTFGGSTLGRRREELIATHVSRLNGCQY